MKIEASKKESKIIIDELEILQFSMECITSYISTDLSVLQYIVVKFPKFSFYHDPIPLCNKHLENVDLSLSKITWVGDDKYNILIGKNISDKK